jgi:hypothetical protein
MIVGVVVFFLAAVGYYPPYTYGVPSFVMVANPQP